MSTFVVNSSLDDAGDVELMFPGDRFPVIAGPILRANGWRGGVFVTYVTGNEPFTVELSDSGSVAVGGNGCTGFLLFQSEDYDLSRPYGNGPWSPENFTSQQPREGVGGQNVVTLVNGGTRAYFRMFETVGRFAPIVGAPITYTLGEALFVSENGLLCNRAGMAGTPFDPNFIEVGICSAIPSAANANRLCMDMKF